MGVGVGAVEGACWVNTETVEMARSTTSVVCYLDYGWRGLLPGRLLYLDRLSFMHLTIFSFFSSPRRSRSSFSIVSRIFSERSLVSGSGGF